MHLLVNHTGVFRTNYCRRFSKINVKKLTCLFIISIIGLEIPLLLEAILKLFPLDIYVSSPVGQHIVIMT